MPQFKRLRVWRSSPKDSGVAPSSGITVAAPSFKSGQQDEVSAPATSSNLQELEPHDARDIWKEAFDSLPQQERDALRAFDENDRKENIPPKIIAVENVIKVTQSEYEEYSKRSWHIRRGDITRETNLRILAKETLISALKFKDIIDQGLKFDPSGYGTVVWVVVSGAMTLVQNDNDRVVAVFGASTVMAKSCQSMPSSRLTIVIDLHRKEEHSTIGYRMSIALF